MKKLSSVLFTFCLLVTFVCAGVELQAQNESNEKVEVSNSAELIIGIWKVDKVEIEIDKDQLPEPFKEQFEGNSEMFKSMQEGMQEQMLGETMAFQEGGVSIIGPGTRVNYSIVNEGKTLRMRRSEKEDMEIKSITDDKMILIKSASGISLIMELSKTGGAEDVKALAAETERTEWKNTRSQSEVETLIIGKWDIDDIDIELDYDKMLPAQRAVFEEDKETFDEMMQTMEEKLKTEENAMIFHTDGTVISNEDTSNYNISQDGNILSIDRGGDDMYITEISETTMTLLVESQPGMILKLRMVKN